MRRFRSPTTVEPRAVVGAVSEAAFQATVIEYVRLLGYLVYHTHDSRHSEAGFPDLMIAGPVRAEGRGRCIFAELKSERGQLSEAQRTWLAVLRDCPGAEVYLWKPSSWSEIEEVLKR